MAKFVLPHSPAPEGMIYEGPYLKQHELGVRLEHPPEGDPPYVVQVEE